MDRQYFHFQEKFMPSIPPYRYIILGVGRQGTAAAHNLARFGEAERITLAKIHIKTAVYAAQHVN